MLKDFSIGTIIYVIISALFGKRFDMSYYLFSLVLSILPDTDFVLYILLKKRSSLVTHHIIHYPIFFIIIGLFIFITSQYLGTLFIFLSLCHFVLDSFSTTEYPTGIRWFYPFSKKSWYILQGKIYQLTTLEQTKQLDKRRILWNMKGEKRTILWEFIMRIDKLTELSTIFIIFAIAVFVIFILGS